MQACTCLKLPVLYAQNLVTVEALNKMITDYYNFSILGSQTTSTGFKVEPAKPSLNLKGNVLSSANRSFITNIELEGGLLDNSLVQLFSGKTVSSYFKATLGLNALLPANKASFFTISATERNYDQQRPDSSVFARDFAYYGAASVISLAQSPQPCYKAAESLLWKEINQQ